MCSFCRNPNYMFESGNAIFLAVLYAVLTVITVITSIINQSADAPFFLSTGLMILLFVLIVYDTDCLTTGGCTGWSLLRSALYAILPVLIIVAYLYVAFTSREVAPPPKKEEIKPKAA